MFVLTHPNVTIFPMAGSYLLSMKSKCRNPVLQYLNLNYDDDGRKIAFAAVDEVIGDPP